MDYNKVGLTGRLTRDPEVRYTQNGKVNCTFTIAVDRYTPAGANKEADFVPVVVWGKLAEACGNNLIKGRKVLVDGRLQIRSYEAKDGSGKRWVTEIVANEVIFLESLKKQGEQQTSSEQQSFAAPVEWDESIPF